jgi:hypothetical protein
MLAEPWGYARQNIAPLVLVKVWAARQGTVSPHSLHFVLTTSLTVFRAYALENYNQTRTEIQFSPSNAGRSDVGGGVVPTL